MAAPGFLFGQRSKEWRARAGYGEVAEQPDVLAACPRNHERPGLLGLQSASSDGFEPPTF